MITVIDYGLGNLGSMLNMLKKIGADAVISSNIDRIQKSEKLILPGVGSFDIGMEKLADKRLISILEQQVFEEKKSILGVCLGMQLLCKCSEEGSNAGLGWIDAEVLRSNFSGKKEPLKVPHMGWNQVNVTHSAPLLTGLEHDNRFYFVHSYYVSCANASNILATTSYGLKFASAVISDNIMGVQFYPEKSHKFGMTLLKNFVERA